MKFLAIIQARLSSQRLPNKVIAPLDPTLNKPLILEHLIERLSRVQQVDEILVAVPDDEYLLFKKMSFLKDISIKQGEKYDVLKRFLVASRHAESEDYVIRITADNPLIDYQILEENISFVKEEMQDYSYPAWLPLGMGFEICQLKTLREMSQLNLSDAHKEHVTTYIKENPKKYKIQPMLLDKVRHPFYKNIRLTIDEAGDLATIQKLYQHFEKEENIFFCAPQINNLYEKDSRVFLGNQDVQQKSHHLSEVVWQIKGK